MIELKNIDLSEVSKTEQLAKFEEELDEFHGAVNYGTDDEVIDEGWDVVQSMLGVMLKERNITAYEFMEGYPKHLEKLKNRPRVKEVE